VTRIPLIGGAYESRSVIASAQEAINLYSESNNSDASPPAPATAYPTPGLALESTSPYIEGIRTLYRASNGALYAVVGPDVYSISISFAWTLLGTIPDNTTPVSFADNGMAIVLVDGTTTGYAIDMDTGDFGTITDPSFLGGISAAYQDTFFIFNNPGTAQFYISLSNVTFEMLTGITGRILSGSIATAGSGYTNGTYTLVPLTGGTGIGAQATFTVSGTGVTGIVLTAPGSGYSVGDVLGVNNSNLGGGGSGFGYSVEDVATAFDPLDIAAKSTADPIVALATVHGELWLIGTLNTEPWYDAGAADFAYQRIQGAFVAHGCAAPYSVAVVDNSMLLLSQDLQGHGVVVMSDGYAFKQVSTHAIEQDIQTYSTVADAIGYCHQIEGHLFYVLTFPSADKTWSYDIATGQWHRRASIDGNGVLHRHRSNCYAFAYGLNLVGDYQNGNLYSFSNEVFTDNGTPIPRIRRFPHMVNDGNRISYRQFQADMATGQMTGGESSDPPLISLRWSDDKGFSYGNAVTQSMGATGQYLASPNWQRLGMARDRVFELSWSTNANTALNGCWINVVEAAT